MAEINDLIQDKNNDVAGEYGYVTLFSEYGDRCLQALARIIHGHWSIRFNE